MKRLVKLVDLALMQEIQLDMECVDQQLWSGAAMLKKRAISARCSLVKKYGASCFPSQVPGRTSRGCPQKVYAMETSG